MVCLILGLISSTYDIVHFTTVHIHNYMNTNRKRYTDSSNQVVVTKLITETRAQDVSIPIIQIKGTFIQFYHLIAIWYVYRFNTTVVSK